MTEHETAEDPVGDGAAETGGPGTAEAAGGTDAAEAVPETEAAEAPPDPIRSLAARAHAEATALDRELAEIDMLVQQATTEAGRHEAKRAQAAERLASPSGGPTDPKELADLNAQLLTLTRRSSVMEAQVEVLTGKQKALRRYRDALAGYAGELGAMTGSVTAVVSPVPSAAGVGGGGIPGALGESGPGEVTPPGVARLVLGAQEELRREIARAMHDGPAQSLTNIVLQAQIVDRLLSRDPEMAKTELRQLVAMVQATLDATKTFIFDVRPMVLDDLGLVPTLRRAARERGRQAGVPVDLDSMGSDRRLSMELESGLFRILDEALGGYLAGRPDRVAIVLDWGDALEARVAALKDAPEEDASAEGEQSRRRPRLHGRGKKKEELPPALAAMIEDRRIAEELAHAPVPLPAATWREIQERAATIGVTAELGRDGAELSIVAPLPPAG